MSSHEGQVKILLVDDKPEQLLALEAVLEELDECIVRAYNGRDALRKLLHDEFAVILLDVNMPDMDGFETAALIRQRKSTKDVPIIFVTGFADEAYRARGYALGAVDYISTPVIPEVLKTKVSVFVDLYRKTAQVRRQADWQRRRANQLQKLAAASVAINRGTSIERMLRTITDVARDIVGAHQAITLFTGAPVAMPQPARPQAFGSFSDKYGEWRGRPLRIDDLAQGIVSRCVMPVRLTAAELLDHPDWDIGRDGGIPPARGGILAAPLAGREGRNMGILYLCDHCDGDFTDDDQAILVQLAQMATSAIESAFMSQEREANRLKDEFLSTLSHELRTPLNAVLGWTQLLRLDFAQSNGSELSHGLEVIERNARAQVKLIEDMLDVSRISTGKFRLSIRAVSLDSVITAAVDAVRPAADAKHIELAMNVPASLQPVSADPDRLQQVVWNLLSNAVKFTPDGGRVELALEQTDSVRIRVTDSGVGISREFLPHVFDRFRQADSSSTRTHGGLGIGLTIVRHIVELHGGTVHAQSAGEGTGATFVVMLPLHPTRLPTDSKNPAVAIDRVSSNGDEQGVATNWQGIRVLVVDDDPDAREMLGMVLRQFGVAVTLAANVDEALEAVQADRPDVLISDIAMPDRDGFDLIRSLRELPEGADIPAVAITAYAAEGDRLRALAAGFQAHAAKPLEANELRDILTRLLRPARRHADDDASSIMPAHGNAGVRR